MMTIETFDFMYQCKTAYKHSNKNVLSNKFSNTRERNVVHQTQAIEMSFLMYCYNLMRKSVRPLQVIDLCISD